MLAYRVNRHGGPEALEWSTLPDPEPRPGEALVRVHACALNRLDLWVRQGVPGHKFPLPLIPGSEIAGELVAYGDDVWQSALAVKPGDPVLVAPGLSCGVCPRCLAGEDPLCRHYGILGETRDGGYGELAVVPARNILPRPVGLSAVEAAAIPLTFLTAWHMLEARARLKPLETVLVQAAGSGVGTAAIQIARLLGARTIIATAGSDAKLERAKALGASHTVNYVTGDFVKTVKEITGGAGVDVVVEHVGGEVFEKSLRTLGVGGRLVLCGATAGAEATVNLRAAFFKGLSILGSTMGSLAELKNLLRYFPTGQLRAVVDRTFSLRDAPRAQAALEERTQFGKIVLEVG
jgi:NADPH:quinone reductase-like Zn-dependent oxidoreductase